MMKDDAGSDIDVERIDAFDNRDRDSLVDVRLEVGADSRSLVAEDPDDFFRQGLFLQRCASLVGRPDGCSVLAQLGDVREQVR